MRSGTPAFRLGLWLASSALTLNAALPAYAQPAPPASGVPGAPDGAPEAGNPDGSDPPQIAGRIARIRGTVSFHANGEENWRAAEANYPITTGDALWTETKSDATVDIGADRVVLAGATELDFVQLDQNQFVTTEAQGAIYLRLRDLPDGQSVTVNTPRAAVRITQPGRYEIIAGDTTNPTTVTVVEGGAHIEGNGVALDVGARQTAGISGSDQYQGQVFAMQTDAFLDAQLREEAPRPPPQAAVPPPAPVQYMTGAEDLQQYGSWSSTQEYGAVWYPRSVPAGWAPYRTGRWAWVAPWGWTWVDAQPWGFAPFHYGRWVYAGNRWGWCAAEQGIAVGVRPVYAPALVSFVGVGGALLTGAAIGFAAGALAGGGGVGWVPLGFREPFRPWYRSSDVYIRNVNRVNITNINVTNIRNVTINNYVNARAATVVPANAMVRAERLDRIARPLPANVLRETRPLTGRLPVAPTAATPGITRVAAQRYNIALPQKPVRPVAPGPQIRPAVDRPQGRPELRPAALPANVRPAPMPRPGINSVSKPGEALPGTRPGPAPRPAEGRLPPGANPERPGIQRPEGRPAGERPGLPPLRDHNQIGKRPDQPVGLQRPGNRPEGGLSKPGQNRPEGQLPGTRPGTGTPGASRPGGEGATAKPAPGAKPGLPELRPSGGGRPPVPEARPGGGAVNRPQPQRERPAPQPERPAPQVQRPTPHPQPQAERPAPQVQRPTPRPAPQAERPAPRPQPQVERPQPRPMPQVERPTPRPQPQIERPQPRPQPQFERPQPRPQPQFERPQPRPQPQPQPRPEPRQGGGGPHGGGGRPDRPGRG